MYYSQGTVSTVSGSVIVRGTGTQFKSNINGVAPGQIILIQSGNNNLLHMIRAVNSDTELTLADNVTVTLNNATYQIQTTIPDSVGDAARHMVAINSYVIQFLQNMDKWLTQDATVNVTLPNGQTVSLQSIREMIRANIPSASFTTPGIVKLSSVLDSNSELIAATSLAVKQAHQAGYSANQNANNRLEKWRNGTDIHNKSEFVKNRGLIEIRCVDIIANH
ncbi:NgrE (Modular protein) [Xenorhabdus poinarii G6]|uniref:NgrE (Modular protein) n=1 Tax=Xenorhabdus poinarii G6 TaxID=1354304 RepID=A0A068R3B4_9GAMM|nr:phage tail protein [Xenorhabdus poinarii]CDG20620.1 NgrE (Modular protein) [Xenorhabdus poinarii G6]